MLRIETRKNSARCECLQCCSFARPFGVAVEKSFPRLLSIPRCVFGFAGFCQATLSCVLSISNVVAPVDNTLFLPAPDATRPSTVSTHSSSAFCQFLSCRASTTPRNRLELLHNLAVFAQSCAQKLDARVLLCGFSCELSASRARKSDAMLTKTERSPR